jgi:GAF domain-containing protein
MPLVETQELAGAADTLTMARSFAQEMRSIGSELADGRIDHSQSQRALARVLQQRFGCARISYWTLAGKPGERRMLCVFSHGDDAAARSVGETLTEAECPDYFAAHTQRRVWACEDTLEAPDLAPIRRRYLLPGAARSLLEAAFSVNGKPFAVLSCEHVGEPRQWSRVDVMTMMRVAGGMSLFIARYERERPAAEAQRAG